MAQAGAALPSSPGTFARASSGLVRSVGTTDAMWYGLNAITIAYIGFTLIDWVAYPGTSFEWSVLITTLGSIGVGIVYALLAATYPRSGGEYVFLSRIVRPELGFVVSFVQAFFYSFYFGLNGAFFAMFGLAPMFSTLGLQLKNGMLTDWGTWFGSGWGVFIAGTCVVALVAFLAYRGMGTFFRIQRWCTLIALGAVVLTFVVLALGGLGVLNFKSAYDAALGTGTFDKLTNGVTVPGSTVGQTLNFMVWPAFSILFSVNLVAFSGEVKNVRRAPIIGIVGSMIICGIIFIAFMVFARWAEGEQFLVGAASQGYTFQTLINGTASILANNPIVTILINMWVILIIPFALGSNIIYASRALFAWGIDGMGPEKLAEVSPKYHSPMWAILLIFVIAEGWLAIYVFTAWVGILSGLLAFSAAFFVVCVTGIFFPYVKREVFERSPAAQRVAGIPVMTIAGVVGAVFTGFLFWRCTQDAYLNAVNTDNPISLEMTVGALVIAIVWFFAARWYRARRGVALDKRFKEIPVE
jgi:amino acid transporter